LAAWSEHWFPDAAVIAFLGVVVIFVLAVLAGENSSRLVFEGGKELLDAAAFHHTDGDDHPGWARGRLDASRAERNPATCPDTTWPSRRYRMDRALFDVDVFDLLGPESDLQRRGKNQRGGQFLQNLTKTS
jgi:hypothetical protein